MQALESGAIRVERIAILFDFDGDFDFQHSSQFHAAPRIP
jgi:hypothetical protein